MGSRPCFEATMISNVARWWRRWPPRAPVACSRIGADSRMRERGARAPTRRVECDIGTGAANVTRQLQSGAAGSRAALRGFRAALLAALRCHPGSPVWQQGCQQGSPAPIHGSPALPSWQPCAAILAALRGSSAATRQPCAAALRGSPGGSRAGPRWQPCAAPAALRGSPGRGLFREVRGGASTPPLHPSHPQNGEAHARLRGS